MTVLNVGRFAGSGGGACPEMPLSLAYGHVPKRLIVFAAYIRFLPQISTNNSNLQIETFSCPRCPAEEYRSEIRAAIVLFALNCADSDDAVRMRIALAEVNRLDKMHGYGTSTDSLDKLT